MSSPRIAARLSSAFEAQRSGSPTAASGEYALGQFEGEREPDSPRTIEVGLSVCPMPPATEPASPPHLGIRQEVAIADERGLVLLTDSLLPVGTRVALEIHLSAWTTLCVFGHVRWHGGAAEAPAMGIGIAFEELPSAARCQLMTHLGVEQREATPSEAPRP